jgi:hypothetical protein
MKSNTQKTTTGFKAFNTVYFIGSAFAALKLLDYLQWTVQLARKWQLPEAPFFSKVNLTDLDNEMSLTAYLVFALAYILAFSCIILGLYQLKNLSKFFEDNTIFQNEISDAFLKAGKYFLVFAFGTFAIDVALLLWNLTSSRVIDLLSTELIVFTILGYIMFFLADVFKKGIHLQEENELTI